MRTLALPEESQRIRLPEALFRYTSPHEVKFLCWLASFQCANLLEIGCNMGVTTRDLATYHADKRVYAVDHSAAQDSMVAAQKGEKPTPGTVGLFASHLPNVQVIDQPSGDLDYYSLEKVGFVFIDGDHSYEGVAADTQKALDYLRSAGGGLIAWHDYYAHAGIWPGVKRYLDSHIAPRHERFTVVEGTWISFLPVGDWAL